MGYNAHEAKLDDAGDGRRRSARERRGKRTWKGSDGKVVAVRWTQERMTTLATAMGVHEEGDNGGETKGEAASGLTAL